MSEPKRFLITQSLLSSWQYALKGGNMDDFKRTLMREKTPQTKAMLDGIHFENIVQAVCDGEEIESSHEWYKAILDVSDIVKNSQYQVKAYREITVNGVDFLCYGILDFLRAGVIYDTKFSKTYKVGKYLDSPQHPMYFYLCPEVKAFEYVVSDGKWVYREKYTPDMVEPIDRTISKFMDWLEKTDNVSLYCEHWKSKN